MTYNQLTADDRYTIAALLKQRLSQAEIARQLNRSPSTISRELKRNRQKTGAYIAEKAVARTSRIRRESRRKWYKSDLTLQMVTSLLRLDWSPEQISGWLKVNKITDIATSTIYRYIWYERNYEGNLYKHLRQSGKKRRKCYQSVDSRGVLQDKRHISERPKSAENKTWKGHWEIDTVHGARDGHCIVTIVERKTKFTIIGKLKNRTASELSKGHL